MEGKVSSQPGAVCLLAVFCIAALASACREIIDYEDAGTPGVEAPISWEPVGPAGEPILALRIDQAGVLYAGSESGRLFRSVTDGDQWAALPLPYDDGALTAIAVDPARELFVSNDVHGVFLSIDGGVTWTQANAGLTDTAINALAYLSSGMLLAGSVRGRVSAIDPGGSTEWSERFSFGRPVTSLLGISSQEILASTWGAGVFRFGQSDTAAVPENQGLQDLFVNVVHLGPSGYLFAGSRSSGLFRSDPGPFFWQSIGGGSISREVIALRTSRLGEMFAGTATGVYLSTDRGARWTLLGRGIGSQEVRSLAINESNTVFAGTVDGVYRSIRADTGAFRAP